MSSYSYCPKYRDKKCYGMGGNCLYVCEHDYERQVRETNQYHRQQAEWSDRFKAWVGDEPCPDCGAAIPDAGKERHQEFHYRNRDNETYRRGW